MDDHRAVMNAVGSERAALMGSAQGIHTLVAEFLRMGASPGAAIALIRMSTMIDNRPVLPSVRVLTPILHRTGGQDCASGGGPLSGGPDSGPRNGPALANDHLDGECGARDESTSRGPPAPVADIAPGEEGL